MRPISFCKISGILFLLHFCLVLTGAQPMDIPELSRRSAQLAPFFEQLRKAPADSQKTRINEHIRKELTEMLMHPESMDFPFDTLKKYLGRVYAPNREIRILSWNYTTQNLQHRYSGFLQIREKGRNEFRLIELKDTTELIPSMDKSVLPLSSWYGGLVYSILHNRSGKSDYYTLLIMDPKDIFSSRKILDVLWFDEDNNPWLGKPVFQDEKGKFRHRIIFEYSAQAVMNVRYEERYSMIVYDHLSCFQTGMEGNYRFYGPDLSFDAYRWEKGIWKYLPDVDVKNEYRPRKPRVMPPAANNTPGS